MEFIFYFKVILRISSDIASLGSQPLALNRSDLIQRVTYLPYSGVFIQATFLPLMTKVPFQRILIKMFGHNKASTLQQQKPDTFNDWTCCYLKTNRGLVT